MPTCPRCQKEFPAEDFRPLLGEQVCEDCYIQLVDLTKECDPWATYTARRTMEQQGSRLSPDQQKLKDLVATRKEIPLKLAAKELGWDEAKIHQEVVTLRHLEMLKTKVLGPDIILTII